MLTSDEAINKSDTSFIELPSERNLVDIIKESMEHDKIKDMEYVGLLKEIIGRINNLDKIVKFERRSCDVNN